MSTFDQQLDELNLLRCSILPGESLLFDSSPGSSWEELLRRREESTETSALSTSISPPSRCCFEVKVDGSDVWFAVALPSTYPTDGGVQVLVKGSNMGREEQRIWQNRINSILIELQREGTELLLYQLASQYLFPELHAHAEKAAEKPTPTNLAEDLAAGRLIPRYHALFTSHHLVSPNKRRSLQRWSSELSLTGFAKVGYPGIIYCEGARPDVEEFVANVKAMQWLALRLRFVEPLDAIAGFYPLHAREQRWLEMEKVGEVVAEMRRIGRDYCVLDLGIGSAGAE